MMKFMLRSAVLGSLCQLRKPEQFYSIKYIEHGSWLARERNYFLSRIEKPSSEECPQGSFRLQAASEDRRYTLRPDVPVSDPHLRLPDGRSIYLLILSYIF